MVTSYIPAIVTLRETNIEQSSKTFLLTKQGLDKRTASLNIL